jgi:hypothetical protein
MIEMLVTPQQVNGWRGHQWDRSIYTLANIQNYVRQHPGSNTFEIYAGINSGSIPTDLRARRTGMINTSSLLSVLKKRGKIRSEKPACGYKTKGHYSKYWAIE